MEEIKKTPWKRFSSDVLQKYIGSKTLEELSYYLPLLRSKEFNEFDLTSPRYLIIRNTL